MKRGNRKTTLREKLVYKFDIWLSRGTVSTIIFLILFSVIISLIFGLLAIIVRGSEAKMNETLWSTFMHFLDPGTLGGDDGSVVYILLMFVVTILGLFFVAMLISLITDGIRGRVANLSKGNEPVIESDHIIILGFNESTLIILGELIEAYQNQKSTRNAVVVMDEMPKAELQERIRVEYPDTGNVAVVCRSGSATNSYDLFRCSIGTCRSIIIAYHDDFETIKTILACTRILNESNNTDAYITSAIFGIDNEHAARIAGNDFSQEEGKFSVKSDRLELLMMEDMVSKILTHTSRQRGLSSVFAELFSFSGSEFYIVDSENNENLYRRARGKTIREINQILLGAIAVGIMKEDHRTVIGDPNKVVLEKGCKLILLQEDDEPVILGSKRHGRYQPPEVEYSTEPRSLLIFGCNKRLPVILHEMGEYMPPDTIIFLVAESAQIEHFLNDKVIEDLRGKKIDVVIKTPETSFVAGNSSPYIRKDMILDNHDNIYTILGECNPNYVMILEHDYINDNKADEQVLKLLLYCKHYKDMHPEIDFGVTCEMRSILNQRLAEYSTDSDFVIGHHIASIMMAQIANTKELAGIFETILKSVGYEIHIKPVKYYFSLKSGKGIDFFSIQEAVAEKGEIFLGYRKKTDDGYSIVLNPVKAENDKLTKIKFEEGDRLVVLAENNEVRHII